MLRVSGFLFNWPKVFEEFKGMFFKDFVGVGILFVICHKFIF